MTVVKKIVGQFAKQQFKKKTVVNRILFFMDLANLSSLKKKIK